jgi:hypothetical protein
VRDEVSFIIATFCGDGIVVGSDSRGNFKLPDGRQIAYMDQIQKIFPIGNSILSYTGSETVHNVYFAAIVKKFIAANNPLIRKVHVETIIPDFLRFCASALPQHLLKIIVANKLIAAGFQSGVPKICYMDAPGIISCEHHLVQTDRSLMNKYTNRLARMSFSETAKLVEKSIKKYTTEGAHKDIGGPIVIRTISPTVSQWHSASPYEHGWTYLHHFTEEYKAGRILLHLFPGASRDELDRVIEEADKWSRITSGEEKATETQED